MAHMGYLSQSFLPITTTSYIFAIVLSTQMVSISLDSQDPRLIANQFAVAKYYFFSTGW